MIRKLRHASGWALLGAWLVFGAACSSKEQRVTTARTVLDVVRMICPATITVDECIARVEALLPPHERLDAGTD